jgi:hypothetical protein
MARILGKCSACGTPIEVKAAGPFAGAELVSALCPACTDQLFRDQGGAVLTLQRELEGARFPLGKVTVTAGAVKALEDASQHAAEFLARHVRGDWGTWGRCDEIQLSDDERRRGWEVTDDDAKINKINLLNGSDRIMSEYVTGRGTRLWVITSLDGSGNTTVLLPEEY